MLMFMERILMKVGHLKAVGVLIFHVQMLLFWLKIR